MPVPPIRSSIHGPHRSKRRAISQSFSDLASSRPHTNPHSHVDELACRASMSSAVHIASPRSEATWPATHCLAPAKLSQPIPNRAHCRTMATQCRLGISPPPVEHARQQLLWTALRRLDFSKVPSRYAAALTLYCTGTSPSIDASTLCPSMHSTWSAFPFWSLPPK